MFIVGTQGYRMYREIGRDKQNSGCLKEESVVFRGRILSMECLEEGS